MATDCLRCHTLRHVLQPDVARMLGKYFTVEVFHSETGIIFDTCELVLSLKMDVPAHLMHSSNKKANRTEKARIYELMEQYGLTKYQAEMASIE